MTKQDIESVKKIIIGSIIAEYGCLEMVDGTYGELKMRVNKIKNACAELQRHFTHSHISSDKYRQTFRKEFIKSEIYLISEIVQAIYGLSENDLEMILNAIKQNTDEKSTSTL